MMLDRLMTEFMLSAKTAERLFGVSAPFLTRFRRGGYDGCVPADLRRESRLAIERIQDLLPRLVAALDRSALADREMARWRAERDTAEGASTGTDS